MNTHITTPTNRFGATRYYVAVDNGDLVVTNEDRRQIISLVIAEHDLADLVARALNVVGKRIRENAIDEAMEAASNAITALS